MGKRYAEMRLEIRGMGLSSLEGEWRRLSAELTRLDFAHPTTHSLRRAYLSEELRAVADEIRIIQRHMHLEELEAK